MHVSDGRFSIDLVDVEDVCSSAIGTDYYGEGEDVNICGESGAANSGRETYTAGLGARPYRQLGRIVQRSRVDAPR